MSSMNFPNLPLPTSTGNPMSNPMGRSYMADPNANLSFGKNSGAASGGGGGGGAAPISLEQQIQTLTQECAEYSKANPGGPQDQNCQQRLNQLIQSRNAGTSSTPEPRDTNSGGPSGKDTKAKSYAGDPELDEMERLHQMLLVNNSPYQQQQIRGRIGDILYKRQQTDKRQAAADSHQAYLDRVGRARESFAQSEAARKQNLADRKAQSDAAHTRVAARNAAANEAADSSNRDAYTTALAEGRISPEEYARLMGDTLGEGSNVTTAPIQMPSTPALNQAKQASFQKPKFETSRVEPFNSFENALPKTMEPNHSPGVSNAAKLKDLESRFSVYTTNLRSALDRGDITPEEFLRRHGAATENYMGSRRMVEGAMFDSAPAPAPQPMQEEAPSSGGYWDDVWKRAQPPRS